MNVLEELLSQTSLEQIFLFIVAVLFVTKFLGELFDWFYKKVKMYFGEKDKEEEAQKEIIERLQRMEEKSDSCDKCLQEMKKQLAAIQNQIQDSTRSYIIDKYHYYADTLGYIDEAALQDLERRFLYYKENGGDTFIEMRMETLRKLPLENHCHPAEKR